MDRERADSPSELVLLGNACADIYLPPHRVPPPGGIEILDEIGVEVGGNGANTAITAARLGVSARLGGVLGDDLFGRFLEGRLEAEGVDVSLLRLLPGRSSPVTFVHNDAAGERSFVHHPGTNAGFALPREAREASCRIFHLAAPELLGSFWPEGCVELAQELKARGRTVTLDTFAVARGPRAAARIAREHAPLFEHLDMAFPNEEEARLVTGARDAVSAARRLHGRGVRVVAVKRGPRGALVSWDGRVAEVPVPPTRAVDTCGAGDNFCAGFLAGTLRGLDPLESTRLGCRLGTLCVRYRGALTGTADPARLAEARGGFDLSR